MFNNLDQNESKNDRINILNKGLNINSYEILMSTAKPFVDVKRYLTIIPEQIKITSS